MLIITYIKEKMVNNLSSRLEEWLLVQPHAFPPSRPSVEKLEARM